MSNYHKDDAGYWYERAFKIISDQVKQMEESGISDKEHQMRTVRQLYPFGERKGWAYKCWLRAIKEVFLGTGLKPYEYRRKLTREEKKAQMKLF